MTKNNEEIIIDGVDVSGCSYYADGKCTNSHMIQSNCKNVATCYYKEYKRKEQECEELKGEISHYEHDLGWCSSLIDVYEEKIMKCFYALHQIQLHNLKIKDKDIHLILKEVKEDLKEYNKMKNEELDKKVKDE